MTTLLLMIGIVLAAIQAIRSHKLLTAAIWLAGVSAMLSILLYQLGAREVAVIELSVGAGLVTILFVFAIAIAGDEAMRSRALVPRLLALALVLVLVGVLGWFTTPTLPTTTATTSRTFAAVMWQERGLDVLVQMVLIFAAVLGVVHLLGSPQATQRHQHHRHHAIQNAINELDPFPQPADDLPQIPQLPPEQEKVAL